MGQVFPMGQLGLLTGEELEGRMRGDSGAWDAEGLRAVVRADHGYKDTSPQLAWLIAVMAVRSPALHLARAPSEAGPWPKQAKGRPAARLLVCLARPAGPAGTSHGGIPARTAGLPRLRHGVPSARPVPRRLSPCCPGPDEGWA
jgi:hypothetical protein